MRKQICILLIMVMLFTVPMMAYQTTVSHAEALTLGVFLAIAKYAGAAALTVGGGYALQKNWESVSSSALVTELMTLQKHANTAFYYVSDALYSSIYNFIQGLNEGQNYGTFPNVLVNSTIELTPDFDLGYYTFRKDSDVYGSSPTPSYRVYSVSSSQINIMMYPRFNSFSGSITRSLSFTYSQPRIIVKLEGTLLTMRLVGHNLTGGAIDETVSFNHLQSNLVDSGILEVQPYVSYAQSHGITVDSPWWQGKTVEHEGEQKKMIPGIPWVNAPDTSTTPSEYINNPAKDYSIEGDGSDAWTYDGDVLNPDIPADLGGITTGIGSIIGLLTSIPALITSIFTIPSNPTALNLDPLKNIPLMTKFPFSIPWDMYNSVLALNAPPVAPTFTFEIPQFNYTMVWDFSELEFLAKIMRYFLYLAFVVGLIVSTRSRIGAKG